MSDTKLTSVFYHYQGDIEPIKHTNKQESPFEPIQQKWNHLVDKLKDKTWAESPSELVTDYVRATAKMIQMEYGKRACEKMSQMMSAVFMERKINSAKFSLKTKDGKSINLHYLVRPEGFGNDDYNKNNYKDYAKKNEVNNSTLKSDSVEFELEIDNEDIKTQNDVDQKIQDYFESSQDKKTSFDPLTKVDGPVMIDLVSQVEKSLTSQHSKNDNKIDDMEVLIVSSAVLLVWQRMEINNATDFSSVASGITRKGKILKYGYENVIEAKAVLSSELKNKELENQSKDLDKQKKINVNLKYEMPQGKTKPKTLH